MILPTKIGRKVGAMLGVLVIIATTVAIPNAAQGIQPQPIPPKSKSKR